MNEAHPDRAAPLRRLLEAVRCRSVDVAPDLHPDHLRQSCARLGLAPDAAVERSPACAAALSAMHELRWPGLDQFESRAHRIALLSRRERGQVLAAIALHAQRGRVRLCIGGGLRSALVERVGAPAYARLLDVPPLGEGSQHCFSLAELDAERLAQAGLAWLVDAGAWRSAALLRRVRLALAPGCADTPIRADRTASARSLDFLPTFFPEHAWLFGSPMDQALSASTAA